MSESDSLRDELTKRGVEYEVDDGKTVRVTRWKAYGEWVSFIEYDTGETRFCSDMRRLTPAQAIEATLGRGRCKEVKIDRYFRGCGECRYIWEHMYGVGFQVGPRFCPRCGCEVTRDEQ